MIYSQSFYHYFLASVIFVLLAFRLRFFLSGYFTHSYSQIITCAILFHPLSMDAFFLPNVFSGALSFLFFIEAMNLLKKDQPINAIFLLVLSSVFNIAYCLIPIYFFSRNYNKLNKLLPYAIAYVLLILIFIIGNYLNGSHNPLVFFTYFLQALIVPYPFNMVNLGLFPFSQNSLILSLLIIAFFYFIQHKKKELQEYFPLLFLPLIGTILVPWNYGYLLWSESFFSPSSYMIITFVFIIFLAHYLPRKVFSFFFFFIFTLSLFWITNYFPFSNVIKTSLHNLPSNFTNDTTALKRLLVRQYFIEKKIENSKNLALLLFVEQPGNAEIKNDLVELNFISTKDLAKGSNK